MRRCLPILPAILCGLAAAVLRALELVFVFDPDTSLMVPFHPYTLALIGLCVLFAGVAAALTLPKREPLPAPRGSGSPLWLASECAALLLLAASAVALLGGGIREGRAVPVVYGVLTAASVFCLARTALALYKGVLSASRTWAFLALVPVFWSCYGLIVDFLGHASNSVTAAYMYGMFSLIFLTLTLYGLAGQFLGAARERRTELFALLTAFFSLATAGGAALARYVLAPQRLADAAFLPLNTTLRLGFAVFHSLALFAALRRGLLTFPAAAAALPPSGSPPDPSDTCPECDLGLPGRDDLPRDPDPSA